MLSDRNERVSSKNWRLVRLFFIFSCSNSWGPSFFLNLLSFLYSFKLHLHSFIDLRFQSRILIRVPPPQPLLACSAMLWSSLYYCGEMRAPPLSPLQFRQRELSVVVSTTAFIKSKSDFHSSRCFENQNSKE